MSKISRSKEYQEQIRFTIFFSFYSILDILIRNKTVPNVQMVKVLLNVASVNAILVDMAVNVNVMRPRSPVKNLFLCVVQSE